MPSLRINFNNKNLPHYITLTVNNWYYLFDRHHRWQILADSLNYCVQHKHLKLYGFVFMLNHIHLIVHSPDCVAFIRDFKRFTTQELKKNLQKHEPNVLKLFIDKENSATELEQKFQFWQKTNLPLPIESEKFLLQKLNYIHNNPVTKQYTTKPEHWYWSSANSDCNLKTHPW